jgi:hypothetical protein
VWTVHGPGSSFSAISPTGEKFEWLGTLTSGQTLTINTRTGEAVTNDGVNRYNLFAPAPNLWLIPPGTSQASVNLEDATPETGIFCSWNPRRWAVV